MNTTKGLKGRLMGAVFTTVAASFIFGNFTGFLLGTLVGQEGSPLTNLFGGSGEKPADTENPQKYTRKRFELQYPGNWKIDSSASGHDPDRVFTVQSPGSALSVFVVFPQPTDPAHNVRNQVEAYRQLITQPEREGFHQWGPYTGQGIHIKGGVLGVQGGVRIFSASDEQQSFLVTEQYYDEDLADVAPGFQLIQGSFRFF